jgi:hypothetical protein
LRLPGLGSSKRQVLALIDIIQDLDVLLPVLLALRDRRDVALSLRVSNWLCTENPRTEATLRAAGLRFRWVKRRDLIEGRQPGLRGVDVLLTSSESTHPAHAAAHALTGRANRAGVLTCTVQHGLENIGLLGPGGFGFASQVVFTWHPEALTASLPESIKSRLRHVGRPMLPRPTVEEPAFDVGVFENLHSDAYSEEDRASFHAGLRALGESGLSVLLKPHPAGRWSAGQALPPGSIHLADPAPASSAIARVGRVITTPSTVVLDAALLDRPVALALPGSPLLAGFPILEGPGAWPAFVREPDRQAALRQAFLATVLVPGDAAAAIAATIARGRVAQML